MPTTDAGEMPDNQTQTQTPPAPDGQELPTEHEEGDAWNPERSMALIKKLRVEAKGHMAELKALQQFKREQEEAQLSQQEKLTRRTQELEAELARERGQAQQMALAHTIEAEAGKLGITDPEAARLLLGAAEADLAADADVATIRAALQGLVKQRPWLAGQAAGQQPGVSVGNPATRVASASGQQQIRRSQLQDYGWYSKHRDQVLEAYRTGNIVDG